MIEMKLGSYPIERIVFWIFGFLILWLYGSSLLLECCDMIYLARCLDPPVRIRILISDCPEYRECLVYPTIIDHTHRIFELDEGVSCEPTRECLDICRDLW